MTPDESSRALDKSPTRRETAPITVAIATFNRSNYLAAALESCHKQVVRPERVIVVDDGSSDSTREVVRRFQALDVTYVNVGKIGLGNARNIATALCGTRYICILDDDDIMLPNRLRDHMASFERGVQLSHGGWINFNAGLELDYWPGKPVTEDLIVYVGAAITHGACCYETSVLREFPYRADTQGGADYDLAVRAIRSGIRCGHTSSYVLLRRRHDASVSALGAAGQANVRNTIVEAVDLTRTDDEVERRTALARDVGEMVDVSTPPLELVYGQLGRPSVPLRVVGSVPRSAGKLVALFDAMNPDWQNIEILDGATILSSTISLSCRPTADLPSLSAFEAMLRRHSIKPAVVGAGSTAAAAGSMASGLSSDAFRVAVRSANLRELLLAYRVVRHQRDWEWYVAVGADTARRGPIRPVYWLVTAPFGRAEAAAKEGMEPEDICRFVHRQTDLSTVVIEGAAAQ